MRDRVKQKEFMRKWRSNPEVRARDAELNRIWHSKPENKAKRRAASLKRYHDNHDKMRAMANARYHKLSPEKKAERIQKRKAQLLANPVLMDRVKATNRARYEKPEVKAQINKYYKDRRDSDPGFALLCALRIRIAQAVKLSGVRKSSKTVNLIGCDIPFLRQYLQARFKPGMTWDNRRLWHIDHIIPCCAFDLTDPEQQKRCFHYSNLRPLWAKDNMQKNDTIPAPHQAELI